MKNLLMTTITIFGLALISNAQAPNYVPSNGLIGWWPFNGNANDESGNGNNGSVLGGTTLAFDRYNNSNSSYEVDGINCPNSKGISLPAFINNADSYSISVWFQTTDSTKQYQVILNSYPHQYIGVAHNYVSLNNTSAGIGNGTWFSVTGSNWPTFNLVNWHNVIVVKSTIDFTFYQDGILVFTTPISPSFNSGSFTNLNVGASSINGGINCYETFKGKIDDIGIWNRALTQQEISVLYNSTNCSNNLTISPTSNQLQTGNAATFSATTSDANPSYVWQSDFGQGFQTLNNYGNYSGVNTNSLSISNVQLSEHNQPIRVISTSGECIDTSNVATINITDTCIVTINDTITTLISVTDTLVINTLITGLTPPNNLNTIKVFPNPANSHITIDFGNFESMNGYTLTITNSIGQTVYTTPITEQSSYIDLSTWGGNGIYFVQIIDTQNNTIENRKIVLQ